VPLKRLLDAADLARLIATVPSDDISSYFIWTPAVSEELLLNQDDALAGLLRLISELADRRIPIGHLHATYAIAVLLTSLCWDALEASLLRPPLTSAVVHHLGWVDKGELPQPSGRGLPSSQTYVPGLRRSRRFDRARELGRLLDAAAYAERYCQCSFCGEAFASGQHPLDLLLEEKLIPFKNGRVRQTPTGRALAVNTWHYLLSRRQEIEALSDQPAVDVLRRDIKGGVALAGGSEMDHLHRLANKLPAA
jgi:hypothetical protein